mmetsp:Transcript_3841/g.9141  ORF Transcript_3841/g.9141 Transcript_3841/m.9141 type:complete len:310 (-) Transcript_3841:7-936(-)
MCSAPIHDGLAVLVRPVCAAVAQSPARRRLPVPHRGGRRGLVLCQARGEGLHVRVLPRVHERCLLALGKFGLWLPDPGHCAVAEVVHALPLRASKGQQESGPAADLLHSGLLHLVLREAHQVPQQERVHPGRPDGHQLLYVRQECFPTDHSQHVPLRRRRHSWHGDPLYRLDSHLRGDHRYRLLYFRCVPSQRRFASAAPDVCSHRVHRCTPLHERLRSGGRHFAPVFHCRRGDGLCRGVCAWTPEISGRFEPGKEEVEDVRLQQGRAAARDSPDRRTRGNPGLLRTRGNPGLMKAKLRSFRQALVIQL